MTQKENLLLKAMEIENQINEVEGKEQKVIDIHDWHFRDAIKANRVFDLENRVARAERMLAQAKAKKAEEQWLTTDEGKAYATRLQAAKEALHNGHHASEKKAVDSLNALIKEQLGSEWGLCAFSDTHIEIGIVDTTKPLRRDGTSNEIFGHSFDVYLGKNWDNEDRFEINYGCLGGFTPTADSSRVAYLVGLAKFSSDTKMQAEVARIHKEFVEITDTLRAAYEAVEAEKKMAA